MQEFESLIGRWHGEGELPIDPPMKLASDATIKRLGEFVVFRSTGRQAEMPDFVSVIGGAPEGEPHPMHYFDARGVHRRYLTVVEGATWTIWRAPGEDWNGPDGPGFDQRFIAEIAADGDTIVGRWERGIGGTGEAAGQWELDFPITYVRWPDIATELFAGTAVRNFDTALAWYKTLLGSPPAFFATETEAVWQLGEHHWLYVEQVPDRAGRAMHTLFVPDLDARIAEIAARGIQPAIDETYENGVRKLTYRDPEGNEVGFGQAWDQ